MTLTLHVTLTVDPTLTLHVTLILVHDSGLTCEFDSSHFTMILYLVKDHSSACSIHHLNVIP